MKQKPIFMLLNYSNGGRTLQKVVRRNDVIILIKVWNTSRIELISKKLVSVNQMSILEPEKLGFNVEYLIK